MRLKRTFIVVFYLSLLSYCMGEECNYEEGEYPMYNGDPTQIKDSCLKCSDKFQYCDRCSNYFNIGTGRFTNEIYCDQCISSFGRYLAKDQTEIILESSNVQDEQYPFYCCEPNCGQCIIDIKELDFDINTIDDLSKISNISVCQSCANYRNDSSGKCECLPGLFEAEGKSECTFKNQACSSFLDLNGLYSLVEREEECCNSNTCEKCPKNADKCEVCKQADKKFRGEAPDCHCIDGSYIYTIRVGEEDITSGACVECPYGTYNFGINAETCTECPEEGFNCKGGQQMEIQEGLWRQDSKSTEYEICVRQQELNSCIGGSNGGNGICKEGYVGALCEVCDIDGSYWKGNWTPDMSYNCKKCEDMSGFNQARILGILFFQFFVMYLTVGGTISAVEDKMKFNSLKILFNTHEPTPDEQGILMKIISSYLYLVGTISMFFIEVPSEINQYWRAASNPQKAMASSFDCFFKDLQSSEMFGPLEIPTTYFQVFGQLLIVFFEVVIVLIVYGILQKTKVLKGSVKTFVYTLLIYAFYDIQSTIIEMLIDTIACKQIIDKAYIVADPSMECFDDIYNKYSFAINIPLLIIIAIVIPCVNYHGLKKTAYKNIKNKKSRLNYKDMKKLSQKLNKLEQNQSNKNKITPFNAEEDSFAQLNQTSQQPINNNNNVQEVEKEAEDNNNIIIDTYEDYHEEEQEMIQREKESALESAYPLQKYGYLFLEYKPVVYYWELVKIYQRTLIAGVLAFYYKNVLIKGIISFLVVLLYGCLTLKYKPYQLHVHNQLDIEATVIVAVTIILGLFITDKEYGYLFILGVFLILIINLQFIFKILGKVLVVYARNIVIQANDIQEIQDEHAEQRELQSEKEKLIKNNVNNRNNFKIKQINTQLKDFTYQLNLATDDDDEIQMENKNISQKQKNPSSSVKCLHVILKWWVQFMEYCGSCFCGYANRGTYQKAKKMNKKLKYYCYYIFVLGVESNQISLSKEDEEKRSQKPFRAQELLSGKFLQEDTQIQQIQQKNEQFYKERIQNTREVLVELSYKFSHYIQTQKVPKQFWKMSFMKRNPDYIDKTEKIAQDIEKFEKSEKTQKNNADENNLDNVNNNNAENSKSQSPKAEGKNSDSAPAGIINTDNDNFLQKQQQMQEQQKNSGEETTANKNNNGTSSKNKTEQELKEIIIVAPQDSEVLNNLFRQLDHQEILTQLESFKLFNTQDDLITIESLSMILKELGQKITYKELKDMISQVDIDGNGKIDFCEFLALLAYKKTRTKPHDILGEFFKWFDDKNEGCLGKRQIQNIFRTLFGDDLPDSVANLIIRQVDENGDGSIQYNEFLKIVT